MLKGIWNLYCVFRETLHRILKCNFVDHRSDSVLSLSHWDLIFAKAYLNEIPWVFLTIQARPSYHRMKANDANEFSIPDHFACINHTDSQIHANTVIKSWDFNIILLFFHLQLLAGLKFLIFKFVKKKNSINKPKSVIKWRYFCQRIGSVEKDHLTNPCS